MDIGKLYNIFTTCRGKVATDSRKISGGELFFALKGENFDGNEYALKALEAGAAYAVVDKNSPVSAAAADEPRLIPVPDAILALRALARYHRDRFAIPVLGLTGTNGKTTTKELIKAVLSARFRTHATCGNLNNNIGVPLTILGMPADTEIAVIEMGASHPGDIKELVDIAAPDFGLITNVGKGHLLGFGSFEGVKATKGEMYDFIAENGGGAGIVFINQDNPLLVDMATSRGFVTMPEGCAFDRAAFLGRDRRKSASKKLLAVPYGLHFSGARVLESDAAYPYLRLLLADGREVDTNLVGSYNADNVLAALCIGRFFGVPETEAIAAVASYVPSNNRSQMQRTRRNILIVDAYNANPSSMKAALDNFSGFDAAKKIVLLGDMLELGDESVTEHAKVLHSVADYGFEGYFVGEEFRKAGAERCFRTSDELAAYIASHEAEFSSAAILIKGSRGTRMEKVVPTL